MFYDDTTPIAALTVAALKALIAGLNTDKPRQPEQKTARYVYGLQGIRDIFGYSHATAQRYKNTFLKDAIIQNGRKIVMTLTMRCDSSPKGKSYETPRTPANRRHHPSDGRRPQRAVLEDPAPMPVHPE